MKLLRRPLCVRLGGFDEDKRLFRGSDSVSFVPVAALMDSFKILLLVLLHGKEGLEVLPRSRRRGEPCCQHLSSALMLLSREGEEEEGGGRTMGSLASFWEVWDLCAQSVITGIQMSGNTMCLLLLLMMTSRSGSLQL